MSSSQVGWRRNVVIRRGGGIKGAVAGNHKPLHRAVRCRQAPEVFVMNDMKSRASRKVAVLGPIPRDQIVTHAGEQGVGKVFEG
jgi:hypothetical protein